MILHYSQFFDNKFFCLLPIFHGLKPMATMSVIPTEFVNCSLFVAYFFSFKRMRSSRFASSQAVKKANLARFANASKFILSIVSLVL